jgi:2-polyprenyl-3-methyl-5-hydroxy-6-metoxy-1,4-benzoquinol methylase
MSSQSHWDNMYSRPLENIPWEITSPPEDLEAYLGQHNNRGSALDIGCGTGNYTLYLATKGFRPVVGVDFSEKAIGLAKRRVGDGGGIRFIQGDVLELENIVGAAKFDFILDYSILHHISDQNVKQYTEQCKKVLKPNGVILLVCYTDVNEFAQGDTGMGKYGNDMYFRSTEDIRQLYKGFKEVSYAKSMLGKRGQHEAHSFVWQLEQKT